MSEERGELYKLLEYTNDRISELQGNYKVLNDHHQGLEITVNTLETRLDTAISLLKFFISPGVALLILVDLLRMAGIIT